MQAMQNFNRLLAGLLPASALVLAAGYLWGQSLALALVPLIRWTVWLFAPEFTIHSVAVVHQNGTDSLQFLANLASPVDYAGHIAYPLGWLGGPAGAYRVLCSLSGVLEYPSVFLILLAGWPVTRRMEWALRAVMAVPLLLLLPCLDISSTVTAELWNVVRASYAPGEISRWMIWSRFLMGGGGLSLSLVAAAAVVLGAWRLCDPSRRAVREPRDSGHARLVIPRK